MKINIGSGDRNYEGYIKIDYDLKNNPDYLLNLETQKLPFEDNSVDVVMAHHILEHLGEGYFYCLQELYRVCKHGAIIDIHVPHHRHNYFYDDPTHRRPITVGGLLLFSKKYNKLCKEQQAVSSRLGDWLDVDFEILNWNYIPSQIYQKEFEGEPEGKVEKYIHEHNNIIEELWIQLMVVKDGK
jgi:predicted SAM-dependent methyltransferase